MDRQLAQLLPTEFTAAPRTDPWLQLERLRAIGLFLLRLVAPHLSDQLIPADRI
jgi:hypothetical protein